MYDRMDRVPSHHSEEVINITASAGDIIVGLRGACQV
jgi:hypothetical protein